jgi:hypothetical protein
MDSDYIDIHLDTVRVFRNQSEWRDVTRATCGDREEVGDHMIIASLCRRIAGEEGGIDRMVRVSRGGRPVFKEMPLKSWVKSKPLSGDQPEQLKRNKDGL